MEHFLTATGAVWAIRMNVPFRFEGRRYLAGDWILGDRYTRVALTAAQFQERRQALEIAAPESAA
jgi:hypothetical protein